jgi:hypothetical protein
MALHATLGVFGHARAEMLEICRTKWGYLFITGQPGGQHLSKAYRTVYPIIYSTTYLSPKILWESKSKDGLARPCLAVLYLRKDEHKTDLVRFSRVVHWLLCCKVIRCGNGLKQLSTAVNNQKQTSMIIKWVRHRSELVAGRSLIITSE